MKLWAKVELKREEDANQLVHAFFEEFNTESSISILDGKAVLEGFFEQHPKETVKIIEQCKIIEFIYGRLLSRFNEEETLNPIEQEEEKAEILTAPEQEEEKAEIPTELKQSKEETEVATTDKQAEDKTEETKTSEVVSLSKKKAENGKLFEMPELTEIAERSSSYEDFVKSVLEWLEFGKKQDLFADIIKVAAQLETISWKDIMRKLMSNGINFAKNEDVCIASKFKARFKEHKEPITPIPFIKAIIAYQAFEFGSEKSAENTENVGRISEISCLNEIFISVDKKQPIEERVTYILNSMGIKKLDYDKQKVICSIANATVMSEKNDINIDLIMAKAVILPDNLMDARMTFSKFINDFVKKHNCDKQVKLLDFLNELHDAVTLGS